MILNLKPYGRIRGGGWDDAGRRGHCGPGWLLRPSNPGPNSWVRREPDVGPRLSQRGWVK